jgi:hypothetical protein
MPSLNVGVFQQFSNKREFAKLSLGSLMKSTVVQPADQG